MSWMCKAMAAALLRGACPGGLSSPNQNVSPGMLKLTGSTPTHLTSGRAEAKVSALLKVTLCSPAKA